MSLNKNEFEYLRLYAQKCDHRRLAPVASFGLAADLRARKDRGGKMFDKRKQRSDKYVVDESHNEPPRSHPDTSPGPELFAAHPAPWKPPPGTSKHWRPTDLELLDHMNRNAPGGVAGNQGDTDNLSEEQRLKKLYRILNYKPPEDLSKLKPMKAPKVDLKTSSRVPAVYGRNFNRNAKGWCASAGDLQETANPASDPMHISVDLEHYYYPTDFNTEEQELFLYGNYKPRPKSWHSVALETSGPQDEVLAGDYNPRPKAWEPVAYDEDDSGAREVLLTGDFNPRPKPWLGEGGAEDLSPTRNDVPLGDYNPRPKAWKSKHGKGGSKSQTRRHGDYNARPEPWQASERGHFHLQVKDSDGHAKYGDYNARAKAWKSNAKGHVIYGKAVRQGDFNPRPKAWRRPPEKDDSSSSSSYSSSEYSDDDYSYGSTLYSLSSIPACDV